jgi:gluconokinase
MIILLMGIAGSGKSTIGRELATQLGFELIEGDDFHTPANVRKMAQGIPLEDADRAPWLDAIAAALAALRARGGDAVLACSALKQSYRDRLLAPDVQLAYLKVSASVANARLARRINHFFPPALLQSQLNTLEEPRSALIVDADPSAASVVRALAASLRAAGVTARKA